MPFWLFELQVLPEIALLLLEEYSQMPELLFKLQVLPETVLLLEEYSQIP